MKAGRKRARPGDASAPACGAGNPAPSPPTSSSGDAAAAASAAGAVAASARPSSSGDAGDAGGAGDSASTGSAASSPALLVSLDEVRAVLPPRKKLRAKKIATRITKTLESSLKRQEHGKQQQMDKIMIGITDGMGSTPRGSSKRGYSLFAASNFYPWCPAAKPTASPTGGASLRSTTTTGISASSRLRVTGVAALSERSRCTSSSIDNKWTSSTT